jgi:hypothetical protein
MKTDSFVLQGRHIRLEPLEPCHVDGLVRYWGPNENFVLVVTL